MDNGGICYTVTCEGQKQHAPHERMHQAGSLCPRSGEGEPYATACAELESSSVSVCIYTYVFMVNAGLNTHFLLGYMQSGYHRITEC